LLITKRNGKVGALVLKMRLEKKSGVIMNHKKTLDRLIQRLDGNIHPEALIHSDQGFHYTHPRFQTKKMTPDEYRNHLLTA
jgi:hypothetical protein